jgi:hypothetical protein
MSASKALMGLGAFAAVVAYALIIIPAIDESNRQAARASLVGMGFNRPWIGKSRLFGGCLNGKGGTRYRYPWTAIDVIGAEHHGTVCAGGVIEPSVHEGEG